MNKFFLLLCLTAYTQCLVAQNMARAHYNIDAMCATDMHGRGAANDGVKVAANFLENYFTRLKLTPIAPDSSFRQSFNYDINTFENAISISLDNKKLVAGKDFILHPACGKGSGKYRMIYIDSNAVHNLSAQMKFLKQNLTNKAVVIESKVLQNLLKNDTLGWQDYLAQAATIIEVVQAKLTAGLATYQMSKPWIQLLPQTLAKRPRHITLDINPILKTNYQSDNIIGVIPASIPTDTCIYVTAHYDHLGRMGAKAYFPGANDNASGVSMLIELMSHFGRNENQIDYNIVFIAFAAEEAGLIGSKFYVENPLLPLSTIKFLINLDMLGTGDDGCMVVNGSVHTKEFDLLTVVNNEKHYLKSVQKRGKAANSDHYYFSHNGVPAFFIYTLGGIAHYHNVYDIPETLPLTKFRETFRLLTDFIKAL